MKVEHCFLAGPGDSKSLLGSFCTILKKHLI